MATWIWVNIGSGNGLLPDGTKQLPEPMLTDHQWHSCIIVQGQFHKRCLNHQSLKSIWKYLKFLSNFPGANQLRVTLTPVLHIGDKNSPVTQVCCRAVWHCDCSFNPVCLLLHRVTPRKEKKIKYSLVAINFLAPGRLGCNFKNSIFKLVLLFGWYLQSFFR